MLYFYVIHNFSLFVIYQFLPDVQTFTAILSNVFTFGRYAAIFPVWNVRIVNITGAGLANTFTVNVT